MGAHDPIRSLDRLLGERQETKFSRRSRKRLIDKSLAFADNRVLQSERLQYAPLLPRDKLSE